MSILVVLIQFVFRVTFGVALAMGITPSRFVTSGFYRVHLWVLMGLNTLAALCLFTQLDAQHRAIHGPAGVLGLAVGLAVVSYAGAVMWLYEQARAGVAALGLVMAGGLLAAAFTAPWPEPFTAIGLVVLLLDLATSGLLLGATLSAMFLGHWYLNTPTMELRPLRRLVALMAVAVIARMVINGAGLLLHWWSGSPVEVVFWIFVGLRWLSGLLGALLMAVLTWQTLKIPNTQSATGILYAGVILTFIGELTSQFLSADARYPL